MSSEELLQAILDQLQRIERRLAKTPELELLSLRKAAMLLSVSRSRTLTEWIKAGKIRTVMVKNRLKIPREEIDRFLRDGLSGAAMAPRPQPARRTSSAPVKPPPHLPHEKPGDELRRRGKKRRG